jgi:dephospho-CoA kinase
VESQNPVSFDPTWADQAARILARLNTACGHRALRIDHIGSTAVAGLDARDVIDVQVTVASLDVAEELAEDLLGAGYPRVESVTGDVSFDTGTDSSLWRKLFHASADPGRPTHIHIRVDGRPNQRFALLFVDWMTANPGLRADYNQAKRSNTTQQWFADAHSRAWEWAEATGWPSLS